MVNKHYPAQFKADAVALFRSRPGATIALIADDLGMNRETLRSWVRADDQRRGAGTSRGPGPRIHRSSAPAVRTGGGRTEDSASDYEPACFRPGIWGRVG